MTPLSKLSTRPPVGTSAHEFSRELVRELPRLRRYALARHGRHAVDDVVQDTLLRALQHADSFDADRPLWPWLRTIADRASWRSAEAEARLGIERLEGELSGAEHGPACNGRRHDEDEEARAILGRLREADRNVLDRHYLRGQSVADLAAQDRVAVGTVKARLFRARRRLALLGASISTLLLATLLPLLPDRDDERELAPRLHEASLVIERSRSVPALLRVDRSKPTSSGWVVSGGAVRLADAPR